MSDLVERTDVIGWCIILSNEAPVSDLVERTDVIGWCITPSDEAPVR